MPTDTTVTIEDQLRALVRLQIIDSQIDKLNKLRGDLPEEIRDLEDEKTGIETRIAQAARDRKDGEVNKKKLKLDIAESEGTIRKYEEQQLTVRNNREYDALTKEIETHRARISAAIAEIERLETLASDPEEAPDLSDERLAGLAGAIAEKKEELERVIEETRAEQDALEAQRETAIEAISERYLSAYERLRTRLRDGRAVVPIERGSAAGYLVPPQRQVEIRQRDRIIVSEHDGRILVDTDLFREVSESV